MHSAHDEDPMSTITLDLNTWEDVLARGARVTDNYSGRGCWKSPPMPAAYAWSTRAVRGRGQAAGEMRLAGSGNVRPIITGSGLV